MENFTFKSGVPTNGQELGFVVPESVLRQDLLSGTSEAYLCLTQQGFSSRLQVFLINYNISISSYYPIYA
jgi:hypothetical protein